MKTLRISGMTCGMCVKHVTEAIGSVGGVSDVSVSLEKGIATFSADPSSMHAVIGAIKEEGYEVVEA
jgi:copper chaperone